MGIKVANNAFATLASSITNSATSITLTTGQGARFPSLGAGDYFYATLVDTSNNLEIVKCTARSTDVLTVVRAQESTTARAYSAGDRIEIRLTAATFTDATQSLPTQTGNAGKYLKTDGTNATWESISSVTPTSVSDQANSSTGYFDLPAGTTAQRPGTPGSGMVRFNTTLGIPEWYDPASSQWLGFYQGANYNIEVIVVGGGGGGGGAGSLNTNGGGGGAGGFRTSTYTVVPSSTYSATIGAGGSVSGGLGGNGGNGTSSTFDTLTSSGGGGGAAYTTGTGASGASGGGGANLGPGAAGGSGTAGQGNAGGTGAGYSNSSSTGGGGGGGGATANGANASGTAGGAGGAGNTSYSTWATATVTGIGGGYAGGGGGGGRYGGGGAGANGGGAGGTGDSNGTNATANTGGGGGGASVASGTVSGGTGASGIVIIRYAGTQRGLGGSITQSGGYTYHTFTSSGTFTA